MPALPTKKPPKFKRGQVIVAAAFNRVLEYLGSFRRLRQGRGIILTEVGDELIIALAGATAEFLVPAVVTAAYGATPDDLRGNVKYDVVGIGRPEAKLLAKVPDYGIGEDCRVIKAPVGCSCLIVRHPDTDGTLRSRLWMPEGISGEKRALAECEPEPDPALRTLNAPAVTDQERQKAVRQMAKLVALELAEMGLVRRRK